MSWLHPRKSCSFVLSWSADASVAGTMKAQDTKRTFKLNFLNFPAVRQDKFGTKCANSNVDFENSGLFRKTSVCDEKLHLV